MKKNESLFASISRTQIIVLCGVVVVLGYMYYAGHRGSTNTTIEQKKKVEVIRNYNDAITKDDKNILTDDNALYSYVKKYGPKAAVSYLATLPGDCHQAAHRTGRLAYEVYGNEAFRLCSSECHSGCYHGATEAYFKDRGTDNLQENLKTLCSDELNGFFSHQCIHGIGHGLMAWTNYDLPEALKSCDLLDTRKDSCYTGVFMENIVGGLAPQDGHVSKYLNNDPQYPCTEVADQYKFSCYFLQTSRMLQLYGSDFKKVADACAAAPATYQRSCFESMGRDVGGTFRDNPKGAIDACSHAPAGSDRIGCLVGAAQDTFWDPSGEEKALAFCRTVQDPTEKGACYDTIFSRAPDVLPSKDAIKAFCLKAEARYRDRCLLYIR